MMQGIKPKWLLWWLNSAILADTLDESKSLLDYAHKQLDFQSAMGASQFDLSLSLLGKLFGPIGSFFPWGSNTLLSSLMQYFNLGVLCFAAIVISITVVNNVINTSGKAEQAWQQTSMSKLVVRTALSIVALVPMQTGYSALQVLLMWIVIQSIHVADGIWNLAQTSLIEYQSLVKTIAWHPDETTGEDSEKRNAMFASLGLSSSLVKSQLCYYRNLAKLAKDKGQLDALLDHSLPVSASDSSDGPKIIWSAPSSEPSDEFYGSLSYDFGQQDESLAKCGKYTLHEPVSGITAQEHFGTFKGLFARADQLAWSIWSTQFQAQFLAADREKMIRLCQLSNQCQIKNVASPESWLNSLVKNTLWQDTKCQKNPDAYCCLDQSASQQCMVFSPLSMTIEYIESLKSLYHVDQNNQSGGQDDDKQDIGQELGTGGWITAGVYYNALVQGLSKDTQDSLFHWIANGDVSGPDPQLASDDLYLRSAYQYVDKYLKQVALNDLIDTADAKQPSDDLVENLYTSVQHYMPSGGYSDVVTVEDIGQKSWKRESTPTFSDALWCGIGFKKSEDCRISRSSDNFFNTPWGFALISPFYDSFDPHLSNDVIHKDIQLYLAKLAQSWVDVFSSQSGQQIFQDPINMLQKYGQSLIINTVNFIGYLSQDIVFTNFQTQFYYFGVQLTYIFISVTYAGIANGLISVGNFLLDFGWFAALLGYIFKGAGAAIFGIANAWSVKATAISLNYNLEIYQKMMYVPTAVAAGVPLFTAGVVMAFFIPLLPFLIFTLTVIGWFIMVIEALIAAPLVAIGLTHPAGHEFLGRSQQALMLLVSVFIRPPLILIGFLIGIVLCFVGTQMINLLMSSVILNITQIINNGSKSLDLSSSAAPFGLSILYMMMTWTYVMAIMRLVNQAFGLVYVLPNYICRWIGVPKDESGEAMHLQSIESDIQGLGDQLSSGYSGTVDVQAEKRLM
jgi:hypothetical protein